MLFPAYGRIDGPSSASAALGKHVRACVPDAKVTTHSLRHLMKDRLRHADVTKADQDIVLGHSSGGVGVRRGGVRRGSWTRRYYCYTCEPLRGPQASRCTPVCANSQAPRVTTQSANEAPRLGRPTALALAPFFA